MPGERTLVEVDGWLTDDPEDLAHWRANRWSYGHQIGMDVRGWKPWLMWLIGLGCLLPLASRDARASGSAIGSAALGVALWGTYFHMLRMVVEGRRRARLVEADIRFDAPHPLFKHLVTGGFVELNGSTIGKACVESWAAEQTRRPDGQNRVLVAHTPGAEFNFVVGLRPAQANDPPPAKREN